MKREKAFISSLIPAHPQDDNDELRRSPGTPVFTAPECCQGERNCPEMANFLFFTGAGTAMALTSALLGLTYGGRAADTWAVGVTLYCMLFGRYPFLGETLQETYDKVSRRRQKPPRHGRRLTFPSDGRFWWVVGWFHFADSQRSLADPWGREPSPERPGWRAPLQRSGPPPPPPPPAF